MHRFLLLVLLGFTPPLSGQQFRPVAPHAWSWLATDERSSNSALFVGDSIALVVDPGLTPAAAREFLAAVRTVTDRPVRHAVLTHWHPDHSLGATCLPGSDRPFRIVAHGKTRRMLAERAARSARDLAATATTPAERAEWEQCRVALADSVVSGSASFDLGGITVDVVHPGWSHTAGDLIVWSREERVLVTGDLFNHNASPYLDEGHPDTWMAVLDSLVALGPRAVVAGHFGPSTGADLARFRDYLRTLDTRAAALLSEGVPPDSVPHRIRTPEFADFGQFPQYNATIAGNTARIVQQRLARPAARGVTAGFRTVASIEIGQNPHQIAFSEDGRLAWVAVAGSDRVAVVDAVTHRLVDTLPVAGTPLGVAPLPDGTLAVTRFQGQAIVRMTRQGRILDTLPLGGIGASLFHGPLGDGGHLVSVERTNRLEHLTANGSLGAAYPTGARPFPPAATSDGRLAFVPSYDDGTVTVVDRWNGRIHATVPVGARPSGGVVLPGDIEYAVAVRGEDKAVFINAASHRVVDSLVDGIGDSPFSVIVAPNGRLGFVNNTASHDITVFTLPERRVIARIPVPDIPIVMAVHPSGRELWVSSEGIHRLTMIAIPEEWTTAPTAPPDTGTTEVAVMGMIHGTHRTSARWGIPQVAQTIRRFRPDVVCAEIAPDRWERIWADYSERGVIEEPRVQRFPEYVDEGAILALAVEMGFTIEPCAAWNLEMSDLRNARIRQFNSEPEYATARQAYAERLAVVRARHTEPLAADDPRIIHSPAYDERQREELSLYDEYQNDLIGPGGWSNINRAHLKLVDEVIRRHRGRRVLVTFGAGHKYPFLDHLQRDPTVRLVGLDPYLP